MYETYLQCIYCGRRYEIYPDKEPEELNGRLLCPYCFDKHRGIYGSLEVIYDYEKIKEIPDIDKMFKRPIETMWDFRFMLPTHTNPVTLEEGGTPLYLCRKLGEYYEIENLYVKYEGINPTGSFKDRESSVAVTRALEVGAMGVTTVSSGNAASSLACYAAKAGLKCLVFAPSSTSIEKLTQIGAFDAECLTMDGTVEDVWEAINTGSQSNPLAIALSKFIYTYYYDCNPALNPYRSEGDKTEAYEIFVSLGEVPDWVAIPIGNGCNLIGIWKGFKEMVEIGVTDKLPKIIGVQVKKGDPVLQAFDKGIFTSIPVLNPPHSIAEGIVARDSYDAPHVLMVMREAKAKAVAVDDEEIIDALLTLAKLEGIFAEPTASTTLAAVEKLREAHVIDKSDKVVCVVTGGGLKAVKEVLVHCRKEVKPMDRVKRGDYNTLFKDVQKIAKKHFPNRVFSIKAMKSEF